MKKKLLGLLLSIFILVPTFASAKMSKIPEGDFINENSIYLIKQKDKDVCEIYFEYRNSAKKYLISGSCEAYVEKEKLSK